MTNRFIGGLTAQCLLHILVIWYSDSGKHSHLLPWNSCSFAAVIETTCMPFWIGTVMCQRWYRRNLYHYHCNVPKRVYDSDNGTNSFSISYCLGFLEDLFPFLDRETRMHHYHPNLCQEVDLCSFKTWCVKERKSLVPLSSVTKCWFLGSIAPPVPGSASATLTVTNILVAATSSWEL